MIFEYMGSLQSVQSIHTKSMTIIFSSIPNSIMYRSEKHEVKAGVATHIITPSDPLEEFVLPLQHLLILKI